MTAVVVLAAGLGTRLGADTHKTLVPVRDGLGTLPLLLAALEVQPWVSTVTVVTGWRAAEVSAATRAALPSAHVVHNSHFRGTGPLQSLACALDTHRAEGGIWALTADTLYAPTFLAALAEFEAHQPAEAAPGAVCVKKHTPMEDAAAAIEVAASGAWVTGLAPATGTSRWILAQAFRWPAGAFETIRAAQPLGATSQWQLVDALVTGRLASDDESPDAAAPEPDAGAGRRATADRFRAVPVPADSCFDIDTPTDLQLVREIVRQRAPN